MSNQGVTLTLHLVQKTGLVIPADRRNTSPVGNDALSKLAYAGRRILRRGAVLHCAHVSYRPPGASQINAGPSLFPHAPRGAGKRFRPVANCRTMAKLKAYKTTVTHAKAAARAVRKATRAANKAARKKVTKGLEILNTNDLPTKEMKEPWPANFVEWFRPRDPALFERFDRALNDAKDERPLQDFLTEHPYLLALAFPVHCCWLFPKPRLGGGKHIPDFALCDLNSLGYKWTLIELESPTMDATNKDGSVSKGCHHAVEQILDYRRWVRDNALFEEKQGLRGLNSDCDGWVVIGRRDGARTDLERQRLADFRKQNIEIASYDRLLSRAKTHLGSLHKAKG